MIGKTSWSIKWPLGWFAVVLQKTLMHARRMFAVSPMIDIDVKLPRASKQQDESLRKVLSVTRNQKGGRAEKKCHFILFRRALCRVNPFQFSALGSQCYYINNNKSRVGILKVSSFWKENNWVATAMHNKDECRVQTHTQRGDGRRKSFEMQTDLMDRQRRACTPRKVS